MKISFYFLLGVYILTKGLIPLLEKSADPRVVSPVFQNVTAVKAATIPHLNEPLMVRLYTLGVRQYRLHWATAWMACGLDD